MHEAGLKLLYNSLRQTEAQFTAGVFNKVAAMGSCNTLFIPLCLKKVLRSRTTQKHTITRF
jgi:hypothetical protein